MKHNLLESFDLGVKPDLLEYLKRVESVKDQTIMDHISILHASTVGGLILKNQKENGSKSIKNLFELGNHKGDIFEQIQDIFENEKKRNDHQRLGKSLLAFVFENNSNTTINQIHHYLSEKYQTDEEEIEHIHQLIAPFSVATMGRIVHEEHLEADQISETLKYNEPLIGQSYPGLAKVLGLRIPVVNELSESDQKTDAVESDQLSAPKKVTTATSVPPSEDNEKGAFYKILWPWVALLIISGLGLYIMNNFTGRNTEPLVVPSPPSITDSLVLDDSLDRDDSITYALPEEEDIEENEQHTFTLPNEEVLVIESKSALDSLMIYLETNESITDTINYKNSIISFQDTTSILTISANSELTGLVAILQAYPFVNFNVEMVYDSAFYENHPVIIQERVSNLSNYFNAFGLDKSRYSIGSTVRDLNRGQTSDTSSDVDEPYQEIHLKFFQRREDN